MAASHRQNLSHEVVSSTPHYGQVSKLVTITEIGTTFLVGCLEISLDRFTTTVQIEAFDVRVKIYPNVCNDTFRISIF
jgi:hypothetical protein